jgi:hypothetical protein
MINEIKLESKRQAHQGSKSAQSNGQNQIEVLANYFLHGR